MAQLETFSYGPHELQKIHVYNAQGGPQAGQGRLWVMYGLLSPSRIRL